MSKPIRLNEAEQALIDHFEAVRSSLPGSDAGWMDASRAEGIRRWSEAGWPHRRVEDWRYTDLRGRLDADLSPAPFEAGEGAADLIPDLALKGHKLVFVDGRFNADLSDLTGLPDEVKCASLAQALEQGESWFQDALGGIDIDGRHPGVNGLNLALVTDGAVILVPTDCVIDAPIHIVHVATRKLAGTHSHLRHVIRLEAGAKARILETHHGAAAGSRLVTLGCDIQVADRADLLHVKVQEDAADAVHLARVSTTIGESGRYEGFAFTTGGKLTRHETFMQFAAPHGFGRASGAALLVDAQHGDTTTIVDHALPDCESHETFKAVLADKARSVFQGKIIVREDAQRTDGYQLSNALLLNPGTEADTKPELEIYADDVKCSHGATIGELDDEAIFYLRSRGIDAGEAKALLIRAFVGEVIEEIADPDLREVVGARVDAWLEANRERVRRAESGLYGLNTESDSHAA